MNEPDGIVFSKCTDVDVVLLLKDGSVIRYSHELPEIISEWKSMAEFFFNAVAEKE